MKIVDGAKESARFVVILCPHLSAYEQTMGSGVSKDQRKSPASKDVARDKSPNLQKTPAPKNVARNKSPSIRSVRFKEELSKEEPSKKTRNFYLDGPEKSTPTETTVDGQNDQSDSDEQDSPEPTHVQLRARLTSIRGATFAPTGDTRDQLANSPSVMFEEDITGSDVYVEPPMTPDKSISLKKDTAAQPHAATTDAHARVKSIKKTADANKPREHHVVDSQPPAAKRNTDELIQASLHQSAREKRREKQIQNVKFYKNELKSKPEPGSTVAEMLNWKGKHKYLVEDPYYIQWLFPIPETTGVNAEAQPLLPHEMQVIREDQYIKKRFMKAYEMMLDLYGMKLKSKTSGTVGHAGKWKTRYEFLSSSINDHRKITRIIKALECFGYQRFQLPWVSFLINEIYANERLDIPLESVEVWIGIMADDEDKIACAESMEELLANAPDWNEREIRSRQRDPRAGKANGKPTKKEYYHNGKSNVSENDYPVQGRDARGRKPPEKRRPKTRVSDNVMMQHKMPERVRHVLDAI